MKRMLVFMVVLAMAFNLVGCAEKRSTGSEQRVINFGVMPDVESIPFMIAEKNGYFEKQGVKVNIVHFKSAQDRDSAMQSGQLDGMVTDVLAVVFANEGGFKQKIIAKNDGNIQILAGKNSGISSMQELKGRTVGLSTNTIMEYLVDQMMAASQMEPKDVNKVAIPPLPTRLEMLQGGKIDACILPEPLAGVAIKDGARVLNSTDQMGNKPGAVAFTEKCLKENPEAVRAIFRAYNDSVAYLQNEPQQNYVDFVIQSQGFPAAIKDSLVLPKYSYATKPDEQVVNQVVQWMKAKGLVKGNYQYSDLVDGTPLK